MRPSYVLQTCAALATTVFLALVCLSPGCREVAQLGKVADRILEHSRQTTVGTGDQQAPGVEKAVLPRSQTEIVIGTFNIQTFGVTKSGNADVMHVLARIARQFDCLAIQEIRSKNDQTMLRKFVDQINANGSRYDYVLSPLMGSDSYTEQLGILYDTARIELVDAGGTIPDPNNLLFREPMLSLFRTRAANPSEAFSFALVNVHIDPDRTRAELDVMSEVWQWLRAAMPGEDDVIVLGDFNEPPYRYGNLWQIATLRAALPDGVATNTLRTQAYDNILFDGQRTREYTGQSGVMDIEQAYGLTRDEARAVSDHLPVWASFSAGESLPPQYANQPTGKSW